jgi:outer membrane receptor protein involved in Fe transport
MTTHFLKQKAKSNRLFIFDKFYLTAITINILFAMNLSANELAANIELLPSYIEGRVIDSSTGTPMEYVNVAVYKSADSSLVTGTITKPDGMFKIEKVAYGDYFLKVTFVGFEMKQTAPIAINNKNKHPELGDISLSALSTQLNDVVVTAEKQRIEYKIDKRVINVDKDISAKGGTAANVLENTPSVQVDAQGNITLRGSSDYIVLVDGKPSVIKGSDLLKQLPASSIKQIEVITNPSAKYDAEGQAGIINVIMKKETLQGLNGNANVGIGTTDKNTANCLVNYRNGKMNFFTGLDYAKNRYHTDIKLNNKTFFTADTIHTIEDAKQFNSNDNKSFKFGMDYDINEKNSFTVSYSFGKQGYDNGSDSKYHIWDTSVNQYNVSNNFMNVWGYVNQINADYTHKFTENHTLSFTNQYSSWNGVDDNTLTSNYTDINYNSPILDSKLNYHKDNFNFQYRSNIDYKRPLFSGTLETGAQYRYEHRYENLLFRNLNISQTNWVKNDTFSYIQHYVNTIYSGYIMYSDTKWGIGYQVGMRSEYFTRIIDFTNASSPFQYNKFMLYPSLHFSKEINQKHQFQLSYSRRINRPQAYLLTYTPSYIDPQNIFKGSPYLKPEITDAYEFNFREAGKIVTFSAQSYFRNTTDCFTTLRLLGSDGIMVHQLVNAKSQQALGEELGIDLNLYKWWQINSGANLYHYTINALVDTAYSKKAINTWDARLISNFTLKWGTRIQLIGYYRAAGLDAQGKFTGFFTSNLAVNQTIMKGKINFGISAENIFNSIDFDYSVKGQSFDNNYHILAEGPVFRFNFAFNFNNFSDKQRGRADDTNFKGGGAF